VAERVFFMVKGERLKPLLEEKRKALSENKGG